MMIYRINPLQNPEFEFRRLLREQLEVVVSLLKNESLSLDERVHDFRTNLKKVRALLKLMRFNLGEEVYTAENAFYRELQLELAPMRDSLIRRAALESLRIQAIDIIHPRLFDKFYADLDSEYEQIRARLRAGNLLKGMIPRMERHSEQIASLVFNDSSAYMVGKGLKKIYRQGKKAMEEARADPTAIKMHEWRKKTKYMWHMAELLVEVWEPVMSGLCQPLHQLSDFLGSEHDLSVLLEGLDQHKYADDNTLALVKEIAESHKKSLRNASWIPGKKVFYESPGRFTRRIVSYWRITLGEEVSGNESPLM